MKVSTGACGGAVLDIEPMELNLRERAKNSDFTVVRECLVEATEKCAAKCHKFVWVSKRSCQPLIFHI